MLAHETPRAASVPSRDSVPAARAIPAAPRPPLADLRRRDDALVGPLARSIRRRTDPLDGSEDAFAVAALGGTDLEHTLDGARDLEGACGYFFRVRTLKPPDGKTGVIVQHITRSFTVHKVDGTPLVGLQIDGYVSSPKSEPNADETSYWEVWHIDTPGKQDVDEWTLCSIIPKGRGVWDTTYGTYVMTGTAAFYEGETPASLGFTKSEAKCSGTLLSRKTAPTLPLAKKVGPDVNYAVTVTWDSRKSSPVVPYAYISTVT
jgi:hypothetical protein